MHILPSDSGSYLLCAGIYMIGHGFYDRAGVAAPSDPHARHIASLNTQSLLISFTVSLHRTSDGRTGRISALHSLANVCRHTGHTMLTCDSLSDGSAWDPARSEEVRRGRMNQFLGWSRGNPGLAIAKGRWNEAESAIWKRFARWSWGGRSDFKQAPRDEERGRASSPPRMLTKRGSSRRR